MGLIAPIIILVLGLAMAFVGRRLIWLVVGAAGFVIGYDLVTWIFPNQTLAAILIAVLLGIVAGFLTIRFTRILLEIAGFILIGHAATVIAGLFGVNMPSLIGSLVFVVGGAIGVLLVRLAFVWALVVVSALAGGALVFWAVPQMLAFVPQWLAALLGLAAAGAGGFVQMLDPQNRRRTARA